MIEPLPGSPLRIAVLGDFDGPHTRRWLRVFVERGHDMHAISYRRPRAELPGVTLHVLTEGAPQAGRSDGRVSQGSSLSRALAGAAAELLQPSLLRLIHARRYQRAGLRRTLRDIKPDIFHAHYVVEHGFYGSFAGFHPYVVSAWGSDLFMAPRTPLGGLIARKALRSADLVTNNDPSLRQRAIALGVRPERAMVVRLGIDEVFFADEPQSVNLDPTRKEPPVILSDRALESLYNVDVVLRAFARLRERLPEAQLLIAGQGSQARRLQSLAGSLRLGGSVRFLGQLGAEALREELARAQVYVSVPDSDSLSLSTMEAMAVGAFPVVSDLPSQDGWLTNGDNALRVPPRDMDALVAALAKGLDDAQMRWRALAQNRVRVQTEGNLTKNMVWMERHYYRLAGRPLAEDS